MEFDAINSLILISCLIPVMVIMNYKYMPDLIVGMGVKRGMDVSTVRLFFALRTMRGIVANLLYYFTFPMLTLLFNYDIFLKSQFLYIIIKFTSLMILSIFVSKIKITDLIFSKEKSKAHFKRIVNKNKIIGEYQGKIENSKYYGFNKVITLGYIMFIISLWIDYFIIK